MGKSDLSNSQKKQWAEILFMKGDLNLKEIAAKVGVAEKTIVGKDGWAAQGNWELKRQSSAITKQAIIRDLLETLDGMKKEAKIAATDNDPKTKPDTDGIHKMALSIRLLQDQTGLGDVVNTIEGLVKFISAQNLALAQELTVWGDLYITDFIKLQDNGTI